MLDYEYLDDEYADEKPFVKIRTNKHQQQDESFIEKPSKIEKKKRKVAQRFKEFSSPREEPENERY